MTPEMQRIGRILVEAEGGCWHNFQDRICIACKVKRTVMQGYEDHYFPDFSEWKNFGWVLKIWGLKMGTFNLTEIIKNQMHLTMRGPTYMPEFIDQIPNLVATELARRIEEGEEAE